jgi:hypothetical protein
LSTTWSAPTGTASSSFFFNTGHEDLEVDVTPLTATFGYRVGVSSRHVGEDHYIKKFHSRQTHFPTKRPFLETRWDDFSGSLTLKTQYVYSGSIMDQSLYTSQTLSVLSSSGVITTVTIPENSVDPTGSLVHSLYDLKPVYNVNEVVNLHLYSQLKDWNPVAIPTASSGTPTAVLTKAYYRVINDVTDEVLIPYGISGTNGSSIDYTRLSYNDEGNYFQFNMINVPTGTLVRFEFIYEVSGTWTWINGNDFKFRVTDTSNG